MKKRCSICHKRKAKRKCFLYGEICSYCCGKVRTADKCPSDCYYFEKSVKLFALKELDKLDLEHNKKLEYFKMNRERLDLMGEEIRNRLVMIFVRDPYYTDEILIEGLKSSQSYYSADTISESGEVSLNRVGIIEGVIRDTVLFLKSKTH